MCGLVPSQKQSLPPDWLIIEVAYHIDQPRRAVGTEWVMDVVFNFLMLAATVVHWEASRKCNNQEADKHMPCVG